MKNNLLIVALILAGFPLLAQQNKVVSAIKYLEEYKQTREEETLLKARERIDTACNHPDTRDKAKTWHVKGEVYYVLFNHEWEKIKKASKETDDKKKNTEAFSKVDMSNLEVALTAFKKCLELDVKKDYSEDKKSIAVGMQFIYEKAVSLYNSKDFSSASKYFEAYSVASSLYLGKADTNGLENAEVAAGYAKEYDRAIGLAMKLIGMNVKKEMNYEKILDYYKLKKDNDGLNAWVKKGRADFPNNIKFIIEELNSYISQGKSIEALDILELAIQKDPGNADLYRVKGQTYTNLAFPEGDKKPADFDKYVKQAEVALLKSNELKPNDSHILYSIGAFYNNWGAFVFNQAQNEKDMSKLAAGEKAAEDIFKKAIPYLEKEIEIDPTDKDALRALKQLYLKTGQGDSEKFKKVDNMLKN
ncbi:MAG: hypothetical protein IT233_11240 [Bacteroidia bacterium]|nr:hypothetical protein [Bacteroidia bacterium]